MHAPLMCTIFIHVLDVNLSSLEIQVIPLFFDILPQYKVYFLSSPFHFNSMQHYLYLLMIIHVDTTVYVGIVLHLCPTGNSPDCAQVLLPFQHGQVNAQTHTHTSVPPLWLSKVVHFRKCLRETLPNPRDILNKNINATLLFCSHFS